MPTPLVAMFDSRGWTVTRDRAATHERTGERNGDLGFLAKRGRERNRALKWHMPLDKKSKGRAQKQWCCDNLPENLDTIFHLLYIHIPTFTQMYLISTMAIASKSMFVACN
ncbi:hypothetical protein L1987_15182 [Smallanthus sonchifolius]|uniref:Uncharacterized protein n=1 Tax=Smallanthus sonchifolius TaxID=185202 RepID=A0ACB9J5W5_9ASTR|nr:hypothetical protein L1987_15182 [Smallanthus sonchifolius]